MPSVRRTPCLSASSFPRPGRHPRDSRFSPQGGHWHSEARPPALTGALALLRPQGRGRKGAPRGGDPEETGDEGPPGRSHSRADPFAETLPAGDGGATQRARKAEPTAFMSSRAGNRWPSLGGQTSAWAGSLPPGGRARGTPVSVDTGLPLFSKTLNKETATLIFSFLFLFGLQSDKRGKGTHSYKQQSDVLSFRRSSLLSK